MPCLSHLYLLSPARFILRIARTYTRSITQAPEKFRIFAGEEVPRMALRVLQATHRTSEAMVALTN